MSKVVAVDTDARLGEGNLVVGSSDVDRWFGASKDYRWFGTSKEVDGSRFCRWRRGLTVRTDELD
jgi:hypothetical protein